MTDTTNAERDELIRLISEPLPLDDLDKGYQEEAADAILSTGYRKPRQVTTAEELMELEDPAVVLVDYKHSAYQWGIGIEGSEGWQSTRDPNPITSDHLWRFAPLTVLYVGGVP